ncbi:hypothetical protein DQ04_00201190 [Trypanosoma grayi]|uniref:hypothetical protein n=1 Tax=Trypanosoma grayi TaxID=71804 RepID=UPI0004F46750|nr:hypothetical protein DQ04_00201190 [Trypanosoma grayi]KEG15066.1 hypothetical protein DQ04_00201190 [Trypanosoma grayi]
MLRWVVKEVESPYGDVATMHWAVGDDDTGDGGSSSNNGATHSAADDCDEMQLLQQLESAEDQLGAVLWNSNSVALRYLQQHVLRDTAAAAYRVVELGAGVGCLGIALAMAGARVVTTDLKELVPLMQKNIELNAARIASRSHGRGACTALAWRWGPPPRPNLKNAINKTKGTKVQQRKEEKVEKKMAGAAGKVSSPYAVSSASFSALQRLLDRVDLVVLCDALYGNPKDWPQLLYTLTEILAANPSCEVINFCEQRVDDVEGDFLRLLQQENAKTLPCGGTEAADAGCLDEHESMDAALTRMRGLHDWQTSTEVISDASSDLGMTVRATRIRWVPRPPQQQQRKRQASSSSSVSVGGDDKVGVEPPRKRGRAS